MRIPMNQSNEYKQHTLSCIHQMPVSNQSLQTKSLLTTPQEILQLARRNLNPKPRHLLPEILYTNLTKKFILKMG